MHAETVEASNQTNTGYWNNVYNETRAPTYEASCLATMTLYGGSSRFGASGPPCRYLKNGYLEESSIYGFSDVVLGCPSGQNWTLSVTTCSRPDCSGSETRDPTNGLCVAACPAGFDRNAQGQCVKDCTGKIGQSPVNPKYSFDGAVSDWAVGGCKVRCNVRVLASGGGNGSECKYTGVSASPDQPEAEALTPDPTKTPPETPADCTSQGLGYISGSSGIRCVPSGDAPAGQKPASIETDSTKESGKPGVDGKPDPNATDYQKEETSVENKDGTTTEKTTTTKNGTPDGNGGTTCPEGFTLVPNTTQCTKTTVSKSSTSDFCTANPTAKSCVGTEESDECLKYPDRVGCTEKGTPGTTPDIESQVRGTGVVTPVDLAMINSCPQGMLLPKGLGYYDFQPMCDFATGLKPVILAIAWLSAFFIVLGFSQGDD